MFNAPEIFLQIPDIDAIYRVNDRQIAELEDSISTLDDSIFLDLMPESAVRRWEGVLGLVPRDNDDLADRRIRVKLKRLEKLPYSIRVIKRRLGAITAGHYTFSANQDLTNFEIGISLRSKNTVREVDAMLDDLLPLNMTYEISVLYNKYKTFGRLTYAELKKHKLKELKELIIE